MITTFAIGWIVNDGDMAFGRLDRIPHAEVFYWWHVLPPLVLLFLTFKNFAEKLVRMYHPDVNSSLEAERIFKDINKAAEILLDDTKRKN